MNNNNYNYNKKSRTEVKEDIRRDYLENHVCNNSVDFVFPSIRKHRASIYARKRHGTTYMKYYVYYVYKDITVIVKAK